VTVATYQGYACLEVSARRSRGVHADVSQVVLAGEGFPAGFSLPAPAPGALHLRPPPPPAPAAHAVSSAHNPTSQPGDAYSAPAMSGIRNTHSEASPDPRPSTSGNTAPPASDVDASDADARATAARKASANERQNNPAAPTVNRRCRAIANATNPGAEPSWNASTNASHDASMPPDAPGSGARAPTPPDTVNRPDGVKDHTASIGVEGCHAPIPRGKRAGAALAHGCRALEESVTPGRPDAKRVMPDPSPLRDFRASVRNHLPASGGLEALSWAKAPRP